MVFDAIFNRDPVPVTHANPELPAEFGRTSTRRSRKTVTSGHHQTATDLKTGFSPASARHRPQPEDDR